MTDDDPLEGKRRIRAAAQSRREAQQGKDELSRQILERLFSLPEYQAANTLLIYIDIRSEVRTRPAIPSLLATSKSISVPCCVDDQLELFHLKSMDELEAGRNQCALG